MVGHVLSLTQSVPGDPLLRKQGCCWLPQTTAAPCPESTVCPSHVSIYSSRTLLIPKQSHFRDEETEAQRSKRWLPASRACVLTNRLHSLALPETTPLASRPQRHQRKRPLWVTGTPRVLSPAHRASTNVQECGQSQISRLWDDWVWFTPKSHRCPTCLTLRVNAGPHKRNASSGLVD